MQSIQKGKWAIYTSAAIIPAMFATGSATGQIYKHYNTANVDIYSGLAYLRQTLLVAFMTGLVMLCIGFYLTLRSLGSVDREKGIIALKIIVFQLCIFVMLAIIRTLFPTI